MTILFNIIRLLCELLTVAIFLRAILTWFVTRPNTLTMVLDRITEPILEPLRRIMPRTGMIDITPLVAIVLLQIISRVLSGLS